MDEKLRRMLRTVDEIVGDIEAARSSTAAAISGGSQAGNYAGYAHTRQNQALSKLADLQRALKRYATGLG